MYQLLLYKPNLTVRLYVCLLFSASSEIHSGVPRRTCGNETQIFWCPRQDSEDNIYRSRVVCKVQNNRGSLG